MMEKEKRYIISKFKQRELLQDNIRFTDNIILRDAELKQLPDGLVFYNSLNVSFCPKLEGIGKHTYIGLLLGLENTKVATVPSDLIIDTLMVRWLGVDTGRPESYTLPEGLVVRKLIVQCNKLKELPAKLTVLEELVLEGSSITEIPADIVLGGNLNLFGTAVEKLPCGLTLGGNLNFPDSLLSLPQKLTVGGNLYISGASALEELPEDLTVYGNLTISSAKIENYLKTSK